MNDHDKQTSTFMDYFGLNGRTLAIFWGLVICVVVVVTAIYVLIFGFDSWRSNMSQASSLMLTNVDVPGAEAGPAAAAVMPAAGPTGAQYVCPTCGAVGLPRWSPDGTPTCPGCGAVMIVTGRTQSPSQLAARP